MGVVFNNVTPHTPLPDSSITNTSTSPYGNDYKNVGYTNNGLNNFRSSPLYFVRSGRAWDAQLGGRGSAANYWSGSSDSGANGFYLFAYATDIYPSTNNIRAAGFAVRCIAR